MTATVLIAGYSYLYLTLRRKTSLIRGSAFAIRESPARPAKKRAPAMRIFAKLPVISPPGPAKSVTTMQSMRNEKRSQPMMSCGRDRLR